MGYLLDANVFIEAKNRYYGFDVCPGFWDWLVSMNARGSLHSVESVENELVGGNDELAEWARDRGEAFFLAPDTPTLSSLARLAEWASTEEYEPAAVATFLGSADYYLVAYAHAHQYTVVTQEVPAASIRKVKIPNACIGVGVRYLNTFELLRREGARFVLEDRGSTVDVASDHT
jgi:hypothetical protein